MSDSKDGEASTSFSLFRAVEDAVTAILTAEEVTPNQIGIPPGAQKIGDATDAMKRLYWVVVKYSNKRKMGEAELILRAAHSAFGFEVGKEFDCFGLNIGVTNTWVIYSE